MIDRILHNGSIITLDERERRVSALAICGGQIAAYGMDSDIVPLKTPNTVMENLAGRTVIPGLVDAHLHWEWTARALQAVDVFEVPGKDVALERVAERAATLAPGEWVIGQGWSQAFWDDQAFPTAADLDSVAPDHPVYLRAKSGHAVWVNSRTLALCGIDAGTPDPDGGHIARDGSGQPTGILFETAADLVTAQLPRPSLEIIAGQMKAAQKVALASGLTGFHDFDGPDCLRALQLLRERGELHLRVVKNINDTWVNHALELGLRRGFGDDWIRIGALKIFADGALGPRTALMVDPYEGEPDNFGIRVTDIETMHELVSRASAAGLPSSIHAIGDRAVREALDVYRAVRAEEAAREEAPHTRRHRIEHVQIVHPDDLNRLAELNVIASMQPIHATSDYQMADRYWAARCQWAYNPRLQLDRGVVVAFGSDSPIDPFEPLGGIYAAVARRHPDGSPGPDGWYPDAKVTVAEALRAYTLGPAYAAGQEGRMGKLAPGYIADLVVLDRDILNIPSDELLDVNVVGTMVGGQWRYEGV
jgi:predicted amidohydrolase YtcJ